MSLRRDERLRHDPGAAKPSSSAYIADVRTGGVGMRGWLTGALIGAGVVVAAAALGLTAAGVHSAARTVMVLLFLALGPTAAVAGLLRGFPPATRVIVAFTADVTIIALIAIVMLSAGLWSPTGGLVAVAVVTAACCAAQLPAVRRAFVACRAAVWPG
jgi:hypothetical protein